MAFIPDMLVELQTSTVTHTRDRESRAHLPNINHSNSISRHTEEVHATVPVVLLCVITSESVGGGRVGSVGVLEAF